MADGEDRDDADRESTWRGGGGPLPCLTPLPPDAGELRDGDVAVPVPCLTMPPSDEGSSDPAA
ncbi:MAG TPA: hypothetical protein VIL20_12520 [Sandaracinaceae bacterium]